MSARRFFAASAAAITFLAAGAPGSQFQADEATNLEAVDTAVASAVSTSGTATQSALDTYVAAKVNLART